MAGGQNERAIGQPQTCQGVAAGAGGIAKQQRGIQHHIPHQLHAVGDAFPGQVGARRLGRTQQQRGNVIREHPVDLLRHAAVEGPKPGFHVGHGYVNLRRGQGAGQSGIGITVHEQIVGPVLKKEGLDLLQHAPGHRSMADA